MKKEVWWVQSLRKFGLYFVKYRMTCVQLQHSRSKVLASSYAVVYFIYQYTESFVYSLRLHGVGGGGAVVPP